MLGSNDPLKTGQVVSAFIGAPGDVGNKKKERVRVICNGEQYRSFCSNEVIHVQRLSGNPHIQTVKRADIHW